MFGAEGFRLVGGGAGLHEGCLTQPQTLSPELLDSSLPLTTKTYFYLFRPPVLVHPGAVVASFDLARNDIHQLHAAAHNLRHKLGLEMFRVWVMFRFRVRF